MTRTIWIIAARRTPQGRFLGGLAEHSAVSLAVHAARPLLDQVDPARIDLAIVGNVLSAGQGMNMARQVALDLGLPIHVPAYSINMMCASGMQAVALGAQAILAGDAKVVLAGGAESMTSAPYLLDRARTGYRLGDGKLVDSLLRDGLVDNRLGEHMAVTAERLATQYRITRQTQDAFALESHRRYFAALAVGRYADEIVPTPKRNNINQNDASEKIDKDEHPRADATAEKLAALKPTFDLQGTITAANASGINDGAAMLVLADAETAHKHGWKPLCALTSWAAVGCEPQAMGLGPVHAAQRLCQHLGCTLDHFDTIELNEAFAAQALACLLVWRRQDDPRINPDGGAIALGHPVGASGARLIVHLAHRIARQETERGLAALCVGGGMGMAAALAAA
jgi:acetyl-CoA C-acetyltransferase